MVTAFTMHY